MTNKTLEDILRIRTREGILYKKVPDKENTIQCYACAHRCKIREGTSGVCKIRFNENNTLRVPYGYVGAWQCDPIEKKPFFHAYPNSLAMSFGMLGCDLHCSYCQNWITSQTLRNPDAGGQPRDVTPKKFIAEAKRYGARVVTSTYNEPLITSEWAVEIFKEAKKEGLATSYVSNGNGTPEVLDFIRPYTDLYKIDLKSFQDKNYRQLGAKLDSILETIKGVYQRGFWLEVVTLVIPGFNDSNEELQQMAEFLVDVSPNIPWHVTAFHPDYKMLDNDSTSPETLLRAAKIGEKAGLNFIYSGNLPGLTGKYEDTRCPKCQHILIQRYGLSLKNYTITTEGCCPKCGELIPGIWELPPVRSVDYPLSVF